MSNVLSVARSLNNMASVCLMYCLWYVRLTIVAMETRSCYLCIVELHVTGQQYKSVECCTTIPLWVIYRRQQ